MESSFLRIVKIDGAGVFLAENILKFYDMMKNSGCMRDYAQLCFFYDSGLGEETEFLVDAVHKENPEIVFRDLNQLEKNCALPGSLIYIPQRIRDFTSRYKKVFSLSHKLIVLAGGNDSKIINKLPSYTSLFTNLQTDFYL